MLIGVIIHGPENIDIINDHVDQNVNNIYPRTKTKRWIEFYNEIVSTKQKKVNI